MVQSLVGWLVDSLTRRLFDAWWSLSHLDVGWLVDWLMCWLVWLVGWLVGQSVAQWFEVSR